MKREATPVSLDISPAEYSKLHSKQLGNHFCYSKVPSSKKWNDPRLAILSPSYFMKKSVLDIGCNEGILSIPIAIKYGGTVHGVDIDIAMIKKAKSNLKTFEDKGTFIP